MIILDHWQQTHLAYSLSHPHSFIQREEERRRDQCKEPEGGVNFFLFSLYYNVELFPPFLPPSESQSVSFYKLLHAALSTHNAWVKAEGRWEEEKRGGTCSCLTWKEGARMPCETVWRTRHIHAHRKKWQDSDIGAKRHLLGWEEE